MYVSIMNLGFDNDLHQKCKSKNYAHIISANFGYSYINRKWLSFNSDRCNLM